MVYRTNATRRQGIVRGKPRRGKRRNIKGYINKARGARAQQGQLRALASLALKNRSILRAQRQYQDFIYFKNDSGGFVSDSAQLIVPLMRPRQWVGTMRRSVDGTTNDRRATLKGFEFNYFLSTAAVNDRCFTTMFLVSLRPSSSQWNVPVTATPTLTENTDWCSQGSANAVYLNPARFKVLWTRHFVTFPENEPATEDLQIPSGNPYSQYRRGRVTLRPGFSLIAPADQSWKALDIDNLAPSRRVWLIVFLATTNAQATQWRLNWAVKATTVNAQ